MTKFEKLNMILMQALSIFCWVLFAFPGYGGLGDEMRLFLTEDAYQAALQSQQRREIKIKKYARIIEGHVLYVKKKRRK